MLKTLAVVFSLLLIASVALWAGLPGGLVVDGPIESTHTGFKFPDGSTQSTAAAPSGPRGFYLTSAAVQGDSPLFACATGFHMASLWELLEVSLLEYLADHPGAAAALADMGEGPPAGVAGWVRTGGPASVQPLAGDGNCNQWLSSEGAAPGADRGGGDNGSLAELQDTWGAAASATSPWLGTSDGCAAFRPVWCVQD